MKLDGKYLKSLILEVLAENEFDEEFNKLLDLAQQDDPGSAMQAWEMHEYFDLSEEQIEQLRNLVGNSIVRNAEADEVIPKLQEINFDFHGQFTQVYGVTPPRNKQFEVEPSATSWGNDQIAMRLKVGDKNELEFHFWWDDSNPDNPSDPWIYILSDSREDGGGLLENIYIDSTNGQTRAEFEGDSGTTGGNVPKEEIPGIIRKALGWTPDEDPPEWPGLPKGSTTVSESRLDKPPSPWVRGHIQGNKDAKRLALKGERQTEKGLRAYMEKATENHPNEEWKQGYKFAFQLMFSAQLSTPPSDGQMPYSGTRERPSYLFDPGQRSAYRKKRYIENHEIEENFGATSGDGILQEAWDSQWPSQMGLMKNEIKDYTKKGKATEDILSKYTFEAMTFMHISVNRVWYRYQELFRAFGAEYLLNTDASSAKKAVQFLQKGGLSKEAKENWLDQFADARRQKGNEAGLRSLNKMITSLNKQVKKFFKSVGMSDQTENFNSKITEIFEEMQFKEMNSIKSKLSDIIQFVNEDKGVDNTNKLVAFYKKIKNPDGLDAEDVLNQFEIVRLTIEFIEDERISIDMIPCPDAEANEPCVFHKFEDGFFWHDIKADSCALSARKLNNCGDASMSGSTLYNLMSYTETGKPKWHVMIEWNEGEKSIIQVLGNSNSVPKATYWQYIKWFWEKFDMPEISSYAWEHVRGRNVQSKVRKMLQYLGVEPSTSQTDSWEIMSEQINTGFYNSVNYSEGGDPTEGDFTSLKFLEHSNTVEMTLRIKRRLVSQDSITNNLFVDSDFGDYKNAAKKLEKGKYLFNTYIKEEIPDEWDEFFDINKVKERIQFSYAGNMVATIKWRTKFLQEFNIESRKQSERDALAVFLTGMKEKFTAEEMTKIGSYLAGDLEEIADDLGDFMEGKRKMKLNGKTLIAAINESLNESQYYKDAEDFDTEMGAQAMELGSSMIDGDRDRAEQVEKYVGLKVKKELMKAIKGHTKYNLEGLIDFAAYMQDVDMYNMDDESNRRKAVAIRKAYEKVMRRPMEAADNFDGTQESLDKWMESIKSVQRILFKARDPGMTGLGQIVPETLEIGEPVRSEYGFYETKIVRPETAVKEATEYFRPAIMKTIVKSLDKKSGMNISDMFGINESEGRSSYDDMMLEFDNPESIIHGIYMMAVDKLGIFIEGKHDVFSAEDGPRDFQVLQDEYIFEVDSKQDALKLQDALRDFYRTIKKEIYIGADWYDGTPKVFMDIEK